MIAVQDLHLTLPGNAGPVEILKGINLSVAKGESLGLIGPSGSGKSSLLMVLAGLEAASSGHLRVLGQDLRGLSEDGLARFRCGRIGIVFQSFHLIPTLTARENVILPLELAGERDPGAAADAALASVGLAPRAHHYPAQLSGGEQQRVALARALAPKPALLLADEPTGNLDAQNGAAVMDLLFALPAAYGATLVLVTHAPELARRCSRLVHMADGRLAPEPAAPVPA